MSATSPESEYEVLVAAGEPGVQARHPGMAGIVGALWRSTHPGPVLVMTTLGFALGVAVGLEPWRLALLTSVVLTGQLSIGLSNDAIDADRDRINGRTDKPIAQGAVSRRTAWIAAWTCLALALVLSVPLGMGLLIANAITIAAAWLYNVGLKQTAFSLVPFLSFGLFPSLATLSAADAAPAAPWASAAAASLGVAVHFVNVLPDLDADERTAVRGLPHRLGARASALLAAIAVLAGAVAVLLGPVDASVAQITPLAWLFFALVTASAVVTLVLALLRPTTRTPFRLVMLGALLLAIQLVATGTSLGG